MNPKALAALDRRLTDFLQELLAPMGRSERRGWARKYLEGLPLDGERKSIEPMAARVGADVQALRQFAGQSPWAVEEVQRALAHKVVDTLSAPQVWMIAEPSEARSPKDGAFARRAAPEGAGKLLSPRPGVDRPGALLGAAAAAGSPVLLPPLVPSASSVVADSACGNDCAFRRAPQARGLEDAAAVEPSTKVWTSDPEAVALPPPKPRGRPWQRRLPESLPPTQDLGQVARELPAAAWRQITWRHGSKGPMRSRLAQVPVWAAHRLVGPEQRRAGEWLLIEWPEGADGPTDYWLCQLAGASVGLRRLIRVARARWRVEPRLPGTQGRARARPLRRPALAGLAPSRHPRVDGLWLPALRTGARQKKLLVRRCRRPVANCKRR